MKARFRPTLFHLWAALLGVLVVAGVAAGFIVFTRGLIVTNLTDVVPWGLWITIDLSSIAMSAGAFLLCAAVYLLGLKRFQPVARTATFIGLIGYSMAVLTLLLDIGRPDRFWHALVFWNPHSPLWEVTMCVTLYFTVLIIETAPIFGESSFMQKHFPKVGKTLAGLHFLAPYLAVVGLCLSMLHQSSLGATYAILKAKPIWYRPDLSVLFMVSAMAGGPSLTVLVTMLAGRLSKRVHVNEEIVERLAHFIGWVVVGYLYFRFWDAFTLSYTYQPGKTEALHLLTRGPLSFNFWVGEMLVGAVIPAILLVVKRFRQQPLLRMLALACVVGGVVAYRWDVNMAGQLTMLSYLPTDMFTRYTTYFPSVIEMLAGGGVVAYGILAVSLGIRYLNIVDHRPHGAEALVEAEIPVPEEVPAQVEPSAAEPAAAD